MMSSLLFLLCLSSILGIGIGRVIGRPKAIAQNLLPPSMPSIKLLPSKTQAITQDIILAKEIIALLDVDLKGWKYEYAGKDTWDWLRHKDSKISIARGTGTCANRLYLTGPIRLEFQGDARIKLEAAIVSWAAARIAQESTKLLT